MSRAEPIVVIGAAGFGRETLDVITAMIAAGADVEIAGVKLGRVGPLTTALIHDLPAGVYDVRFTAPNGLSVVRAVEVWPS